ncbi:glycerophosphodiester phosphodiesterase [Pelomicrobium methylotrophicum]|uniref:glycerophosphodiester phosphodiesterase n=1 Tax=Pelomicrobium methylotrophicum TaxID=2602750 RepID=A0A5C7EMP7_9PROT|nr:glycerophosphodiester phosphodiesterase [Pelomicrobium methylotrophicum]
MLVAAMPTDGFPLRPRCAGGEKPLVIAHRGASGYLPEHTLAAYAVAIFQGADFIEPDLVMTKDGHLIARHENVLDLTTDVASHPEFAGRRTTKGVDGVAVTGWFSEDFTLAEIKQLRAIERMPGVRPANTRFDRQFEVPTLQEIIDLVQACERALGRKIGLYPETKHPTYFQRLGLSMEEPLVRILHRNGYQGADGRVFIQSFEVGHLRKLRRMTRIPLVQLLGVGGKPYDVEAAGGSLTYDQMATPGGLADIAAYADGVGPEKSHFILAPDAEGKLDPGNATDFVANAHAAGLQVHPYTFRAENRFLPVSLRSSGEPHALGDSEAEIKAFLALGIDGFFTDQADLGVRARDAFVAGK